MSLRKLGLIAALLLGAAGANEARAQSLEQEQAAMEGGEGDAAEEPPAGAADAGATADDPGAAAPAAEDDEAPGLLGDEQARMEEEAPIEESTDNLDPFEEEDQDYFFLGAFYRQVIIPGFIQELFVEGGIDGFNPGFGLQFLWRKNNFNVSANVWWNNAQGDGYFRAQGDPRTDTEFVDVDLGVVFVNAEFMWSFPITDWFAFELGFDLGFGFIYGDLVRTEARESSPGAGDWEPCDGPSGGYCEAPAPDPCYANNGGHYDCREPNWFTEGGDTPFIFPWVTLPHVALRFKPIHQLQIRIDGGYGLYNFFFGGGVSYGF